MRLTKRTLCALLGVLIVPRGLCSGLRAGLRDHFLFDQHLDLGRHCCRQCHNALGQGLSERRACGGGSQRRRLGQDVRGRRAGPSVRRAPASVRCVQYFHQCCRRDQAPQALDGVRRGDTGHCGGATGRCAGRALSATAGGDPGRSHRCGDGSPGGPPGEGEAWLGRSGGDSSYRLLRRPAGRGRHGGRQWLAHPPHAHRRSVPAGVGRCHLRTGCHHGHMRGHHARSGHQRLCC